MWPKGARGPNRMWHAESIKVGPDGEPVDPTQAGDEDGITAVYVVNELLYDMIKAGWQLNDGNHTLVAAPTGEGEQKEGSQ